MSLSKTDYEKRFGQRFTQGASTNALGYGVSNPYYPPLKNFNNMNTWIEKKLALTFHAPPNPATWLAMYLQGFATTDSNDLYFYANALAAGNQVYPSGIHLFFDMNSTWGYLDFSVEWLINFCWNLSYFFTLFIPVDLILASFTKSWEPLVQNILLYVPVLNWFTFPIMYIWCNIFTCPLENGWTYQWLLKAH
jgi:hypothetical protein